MVEGVFALRLWNDIAQDKRKAEHPSLQEPDKYYGNGFGELEHQGMAEATGRSVREGTEAGHAHPALAGHPISGVEKAPCDSGILQTT